ncbi:MAG TPA: ADOP family duplicated permease [Gemmatimonadaceae bacterium]|jgi:predicted permease|nr:ADOP family duplicated permease [Gemmatimonadaceae bacterium]
MASDEIPRRGARWFRLRARSRAALESQVREEIEAHLTLAVDYLVSRGLPRDRAEEEARARFGDWNGALERIYVSARNREARMDRRERFASVATDLRLTARLFRRSPRFYAASALVLALGIGANSAVFSILRATLLQPLPYRDPSALAMLWRVYPNEKPTPGQVRSKRYRGLLTTEELMGWRKEMTAELGDVAAAVSWENNSEAAFDLVGDGRTERLNGALVTSNFFDILGVRAERGRLFNATDESNASAIIVLSHSLWQRSFGADTGLVGRSITLTVGSQDRAPRRFVVAGVLPPEFHFTYPEETEAWAMMPWSLVERYGRNEIAFVSVTRLKAGITVAQAQQRASLFRTGLEFPNQKPEDRPAIALEPIHDWIVADTRPSLRLLGAVAAMLLLVTCVTIANGLLARAAERRQELAVRTAMGAGRGRLVRQLLTEGAVLSLAGAVLGTCLAIALQPVLRRLLPESVPRIGEIGVDASTIGFGILMACVSTLLAAVAPALGGTRDDAGSSLIRASMRATAARGTVRWRQGLVGAQTAIATMLLVSALLLLTSLWRLGRVPLGFDGSQVIAVETRLLGPEYRDTAKLERIQTDLVSSVRAIPGITEASLTSAVPFRGTDFVRVFGTKTTGPIFANQRFVDPGYFGVLRVPLLRGRLIADADRLGAPLVAVVSESYAKKQFGDVDPVGKLLAADERVEVVGVVADVRYVAAEKDPMPAVYVPLAQNPIRLLCIVARSRIGVSAVAPSIRRAFHDVDADAPAMKLTTVDRIVDAKVANRRFYTLATFSFASIALLLTVVGLVVVVARVVTERRHELAIRAALGATMSRLARAASRDVLVAATIGVFVGAASAYVASVELTQFLFGVEARWPLAYAAVCAAVLCTAGIAAWAPVRRFGRLSLTSLLGAE